MNRPVLARSAQAKTRVLAVRPIHSCCVFFERPYRTEQDGDLTYLDRDGQIEWLEARQRPDLPLAEDEEHLRWWRYHPLSVQIFDLFGAGYSERMIADLTGVSVEAVSHFAAIQSAETPDGPTRRCHA